MSAPSGTTVQITAVRDGDVWSVDVELGEFGEIERDAQ